MSVQVKYAQGQKIGQVTGTRGGSQTIALHTFPVPMIVITETVSSALTYIGRTYQLDADDADQVWQIERVTSINGVVRNYYANDDSGFNYAWVARGTLFESAGFFNTRSLAFNGVNQYLNGGDVFQYDIATAWSLSMWVKPNNVSAQRCLYSKQTNDANAYGLGIYHTNTGHILIQMRTASTLRLHTTSSLQLSALTWHHLLVTYDGSSNINGIRIYLDGTVGSTPSSGALGGTLLSGQNAYFGRRGTSFHFSGNLDEITWFDRVITSAENTDQVWNSGVPTDLTNELVSGNIDNHYRFETDSDPTVIDQVGTDDLTMVGMSDASFETDVA